MLQHFTESKMYEKSEKKFPTMLYRSITSVLFSSDFRSFNVLLLVKPGIVDESDKDLVISESSSDSESNRFFDGTVEGDKMYRASNISR